MDRKRKLIVGGALALIVLGGGTTLAIASAGDDDQPLTGSALEQATAAALAHTGGGTVIESQAGDDGAAFGVEIQLDDGGTETGIDDSPLHDLDEDRVVAGRAVGERRGETGGLRLARAVGRTDRQRV